jgi:hypothetical protein
MINGFQAIGSTYDFAKKPFVGYNNASLLTHRNFTQESGLDKFYLAFIYKKT